MLYSRVSEVATGLKFVLIKILIPTCFSARAFVSAMDLLLLGEVCNYCFWDWVGVYDDIDSTGLMNGKTCDESMTACSVGSTHCHFAF